MTKSNKEEKKLCSKNFESFIVDCGCLQNIIAYDAHVTSWGLKDSGQVPPSKEVNEHWSNPNVLEQRYDS